MHYLQKNFFVWLVEPTKHTQGPYKILIHFIAKAVLLIMPLLKAKVNSLEPIESETSASKFLKFLYFVSFIAVHEQNDKLNFKFCSSKTIFNILIVFSLSIFQLICTYAFEHENEIFSIVTIVQGISQVLIWISAIIPVLQPMILRYVLHS